MLFSEVVARLVADEGLEAVSVRTVAAEARVSIGTVQHYFPTKDAMLLHAQAQVNAAVKDRVDAAVAGVTDPREVLTAIASALLPTDVESTRVLRVSIAFQARALHSPVLAERARRDDRELLAAVEELLRLGGAVQPALDALGLVAIMGGLCQLSLTDGSACSAQDAQTVVDRYLKAVLPAAASEL